MRLKINELIDIVKTPGTAVVNHKRENYPAVPHESDFNSRVIDAYHNGSDTTKLRRKPFPKNADQFFFGFEAEKADSTAACSLMNQKTKEKIKKMGFRIEKDSSIDSPYGYELISPIYSMSTLFNFLEDSATPEVKRLIDAKYTNKCGGHITLSSAVPDVNGAELAEMLLPYMPLLYALYPDRTNNHYCRAKQKYHFVMSPEKYSALYIKGRLCEIRLFPAIKNTANLYWRVRLLKTMLMSQGGFNEVQIMESLVDKKSHLYKILREVYSDEKIGIKANQYMVLCRKFNSIVFSASQVARFRQKIATDFCPSIETEVTDANA